MPFRRFVLLPAVVHRLSTVGSNPTDPFRGEYLLLVWMQLKFGLNPSALLRQGFSCRLGGNGVSANSFGLRLCMHQLSNSDTE